jgi:hypothetical protein
MSSDPINSDFGRETTPPLNDAEAAATFRAVVRLLDHWEITDDQAAILLNLAVPIYRHWRAEKPGWIDPDGKARLATLLAIHAALKTVFRDPQRTYDWIKAPNAAFGGRSALDIMLEGKTTDLVQIRQYLDAERSG